MEIHTWPGNLRQLASVLRTASAMLDSHEDAIGWQHLPDDIAEDLNSKPPSLAKMTVSRTANLEDLENSAIQQALESSQGNVSRAARILGISRQTLYRKMAQTSLTITNQTP
jgi:transcriptional regulator of acetoin/glycerol metabolism